MAIIALPQRELRFPLGLYSTPRCSLRFSLSAPSCTAFSVKSTQRG